MATFRVGQRVRILWSEYWPFLAGVEGVIAGESPDGGIDGSSEWLVAPDCWECINSPDGYKFAPHSSQLEPIAYDGNKLVDWETCLWQPDHVREAEHVRQNLSITT